MTARCPAIADYIGKGIVTKDPASGGITLKNGNPIMCLRDETLKAAIVRATQSQSNFITVNHASVNYYESSCSDEEDYSSYPDTDTPNAYNVGRPTRKITETRKDKGEGILGTARKEINRKRTRARDEQEEDPKPKIRGSPKGSAFKTPRRMEVSIPVQTPIDVFRTPNIATNDKDVIMEDPALQPAKKTYTPRKDKAMTDQENKENQAPEKRQPRKSEIQANVDPVGILAKVLQTPVTLQVGEVFGISKEMSHHLQDVIRPR